MTHSRIIRKYANRRLYDATRSRHVTLDDLRQLIGSGEEIKVVDDRTGEDVTRSILLQIVAAEEQFGVPVLSNQVLQSIIRFYGNPMQHMFTAYLEQNVGALVNQQQQMQTEIAKALQSPVAPFAELARQNLNLWTSMQMPFAGQGSSAEETPQGAPAAAPGQNSGSRRKPRKTGKNKRKRGAGRSS